jgi:hypothetical protein
MEAKEVGTVGGVMIEVVKASALGGSEDAKVVRLASDSYETPPVISANVFYIKLDEIRDVINIIEQYFKEKRRRRTLMLKLFILISLPMI